MFRTSDPHKFIEEVKREDFIKIYVQSDITSLCSLRMLSGLLSKEYVKHEAIFIEEKEGLELDNSKFVYLWHGKVSEDKENEMNRQVGRKHNEIINYVNSNVHKQLENSENRIEFHKEGCSCNENNLDVLINMFFLCKSFNLLNEETLWACLIPLSFYKSHLVFKYEDKREREDDDSSSESSDECEYSKESCSVCLTILKDMNFEVKKTEIDKQEGIVFRKGLTHPLVFFSDIFSSLKNDIHFVIKNKLLYKKRKDIEDMKIKTYLAHKGISIKFSKEVYTNLDHSTKKFLLKNFYTGLQYFLTKRKTPLISSVDMAYLLNSLLFKGRTTEAYLILNKFSTGNLRKHVDFIFEVISQIKQSLTTPIKFNNIIIYNIKNILCIKNVDCYIRFVYDLIGIYMRERHTSFKHLVVFDVKGDDCFILYGRNLNLSNLKVRGVSRVDKKVFYKVVLAEENK